MEINVGMVGDIIVMDVSGDLVASTAEQLKREISKLLEKNFKYILFEMNNVNFMDSSGLGACIAVHKMVNEKSGMLVCSRPSDTVSKVFRVTRADKKLAVATNKNDGIKALTQKLVEARSA